LSEFSVNTPSGILLARDLPTLNALYAGNSPQPHNIIIVPNRTIGRVLQLKFLEAGRLVEPYPANGYDMERDGAVEVALFEITEGPLRGSRGWVQFSLLRPDHRFP
jgi:hypothetical protein